MKFQIDTQFRNEIFKTKLSSKMKFQIDSQFRNVI